jgi:hypothetical protein
VAESALSNAKRLSPEKTVFCFVKAVKDYAIWGGKHSEASRGFLRFPRDPNQKTNRELNQNSPKSAFCQLFPQLETQPNDKAFETHQHILSTPRYILDDENFRVFSAICNKIKK